MTLPYSLLDVFANEPFQGTQIPVVSLTDSDFTDANKMQIAREFQQSETVFINSAKRGEASVFNNKGACPFGAHTILAASYAAFEAGFTEDKGSYNAYSLHHKGQTIDCFIDKAGSSNGSIQYARTLNAVMDRFTPETAKLAAALNTEERHISFSKYKPMVVSVDRPLLIVPLTRAEHVEAASFNAERGQSLFGDIYTSDIFLFAPGSITGESQFHGRLMSPHFAADFYPPIGNAMAEFIAYLAAQDDTQQGTHSFTIDRGSENTRKSILQAEFDKHDGKAVKCRIGGHVIKMGVGELFYS
jgi:trans-2,3-dihydro-3-hydroxyanthranilate isomerase